MKNSVFTTLSGCSRVRCGGLCDSNSFGRCGRFIWDQDSRTCMLQYFLNAVRKHISDTARIIPDKKMDDQRIQNEICVRYVVF
jgi:hypothetical protein